MNALKPVVSDISQWDSCKEIIYECPKCYTSFRILGHHEIFCHNCGQKIDWSNIPIYLRDSYREDDYIKRQTFINKLNLQIQS